MINAGEDLLPQLIETYKNEVLDVAEDMVDLLELDPKRALDASFVYKLGQVSVLLAKLAQSVGKLREYKKMLETEQDGNRA